MTHPVCLYLRTAIKDFLGAKDESYRWLSIKSRVPYSKVYRVATGEAKSLSFLDARRLIRFMDPAGSGELLGKFYPDTVEELMDASENESLVDDRLDDLEFLISDTARFRIYLYAVELLGTDRGAIAARYGSYGLEELDSMVAKGIITICDDGSFEGILKKVPNIPDTALKTLVDRHVDLLDLDSIGSKLLHLHGGLNDEGFKLAHAIVSKAIKALKLLMENKEYRGSLLTVFTVAFGSVEEKGNQA